jgi:hypothetical protein
VAKIEADMAWAGAVSPLIRNAGIAAPNASRSFAIA